MCDLQTNITGLLKFNVKDKKGYNRSHLSIFSISQNKLPANISFSNIMKPTYLLLHVHLLPCYPRLSKITPHPTMRSRSHDNPLHCPLQITLQTRGANGFLPHVDFLKSVRSPEHPNPVCLQLVIDLERQVNLENV